MLVPGVPWRFVALFFMSSVHAIPSDNQQLQLANDTQGHPKTEALIGHRWTRPPIRMPIFNPPRRDPPLPHSLYTHSLERIQEKKSASRKSSNVGSEMYGEESDDQESGLPRTPVHSMTAEESWTRLGYPYSGSSRPKITKGRGQLGYKTRPGQRPFHQAPRKIHPRPFHPRLIRHPRPGPILQRVPSFPRIPNPQPTSRSRPFPRVPTKLRPLPQPRYPVSKIKSPLPPRAPVTLPHDPLSVHNVAGPPYHDTIPPHILQRNDRTSTTSSSPSSPFNSWHPSPSTTTTTTKRPFTTTTATVKSDGDSQGPSSNVEWFNNWSKGWNHDWDKNWGLDWSTKRGSTPNKLGPTYSKDPFTFQDTSSRKNNNRDVNFGDSVSFVSEEALETLLHNHRLTDYEADQTKHGPQQTTSTLRKHHYDGVPEGGPHVMITQPKHSDMQLSISRYSEIPLTQTNPHNNKGFSLFKHKQRYPSPPFVRRRVEPHMNKHLLEPPWDRPMGKQIRPVKTYRDTHMDEWTKLPWRPNYDDMVPVAVRPIIH